MIIRVGSACRDGLDMILCNASQKSDCMPMVYISIVGAYIYAYVYKHPNYCIFAKIKVGCLCCSYI